MVRVSGSITGKNDSDLKIRQKIENYSGHRIRRRKERKIMLSIADDISKETKTI